jgi:hypothetical protein
MIESDRAVFEFACVGKTPGWEDMRVIDLDTGDELKYCYCVDCRDGIASVWDPMGTGTLLLVKGRFALEIRGERA